MSKKCSTDQRFIRKRNTTYKIGTLVFWLDKEDPAHFWIIFRVVIWKNYVAKLLDSFKEIFLIRQETFFAQKFEK